jgi:hypothetical protein
MFRTLALLFPAILLAGCISFNSSESPAAPDQGALCHEKEARCMAICGDASVQAFSCKVAPASGLEYRCQCKQPEAGR